MCKQQFLPILALVCLLATPAWPAETATVTRVVDGDTLVWISMAAKSEFA